ncbi:hypothetical protein SAMN05216567_109202 [Variovorax sp. OK605]|uniref:hypothetical protein n=1 Tax=Variovorax sp. OK605 TaxID=1855317 RepID=UPI0008F2004E|nr:hypothetical protein [Variovorax sp. OK605]SFP86721.1 hypothetical protein SAMN05216567_109202 [Variovorax sp. OK605]
MTTMEAFPEKLAVELRNAFGMAFDADAGSLVVEVGDECALALEYDADSRRLVVSGESKGEQQELSAEDLREALGVSTDAMADLGIAVGLHPVLEKLVVLWSASVDAIAPDSLSGTFSAIATVVETLDERITQARQNRIEPLPGADIPPFMLEGRA